MRIKILRVIIILLFIFISCGLIYTQAIKGEYFYSLSKNNRIRIVPIEGFRGKIFDRNGVVLAESRVAYNVLVLPQDIEDIQKLFAYLSTALNVESEVLINRYRRRKFAPFAPVSVADDISRESAILLEENRYKFPSLIIQETFKRSYPLKNNSAHVLGYVGKQSRREIEKFKEYGYVPQNIVGKSGVELFYNSYLSGVHGGQQIEVNNRGQQVRLLSLKESKKGEDISITVDHRIQAIAADLLTDSVGSIIVMDADNGEMLGLVSAPGYDPNLFSDEKRAKQVAGLFSNPQSPLLNRSIMGQYPPGSVFKIPVALCGLHNKKIDQTTSFDCKGYYNLGGSTFKCNHLHGSQTLIPSIAHSCNVYYYNLGKKLGSDLIAAQAKQLGLGKETHIDLPFEKKGFVPSKKGGFRSSKRRWFTGDTLNLSIGQGELIATPIQMVKMMSIIVNYGKHVQPHIIKEIGKTQKKIEAVEKDLKFSQSHFDLLNKGLRATVADFSGTAHILDMEGLTIGGKTGTAQSSGELDSHAWFVGFAKNDQKRIVFCVFLEHGGSSQNAVIMSRQLLLRMKQEKII